VNETKTNSATSTPSTPRPKSHQAKTNNTSSTPIVRQSIKNFLPFRSHTPTNINPILALSNEPFIKLTSFRKFDQNDSPQSSFSLSPNQSDLYVNHRSNSSRLIKHGSRHSLPDVPFQRSHSLSTSNVNLLDSPVLPKFLCSPSDKNDDDEVFLTSDQDQVVATSTFDDSSIKSKVLRASYRGKANTMDRRITKPKTLRSLSTSSTNIQPKYLITKTDDKITTNRPINYPLDSVLNLTLQLEQTSTIDIDPLLLNGLTDDENQLNLMENNNEHHSSIIINNEQSKNLEENKQENSLEYDRIQTNSSINSQTIE